jgi:hypothetical protein
VLHTVGPLGVDASDPTGFDIAADGGAYAAFLRSGRRGQELLSLDLASGRAAPSARLSGIGTFLLGRRDPIRALAAAGRVADDRTRPGLVFTPVATPTVGGLLRGRALRLLVSCSEACGITVALRHGGGTVGRARRDVRERAGVVAVRLRLSRAGRRAVRRAPRRRLRLRVTARDAAGNVTRTR